MKHRDDILKELEPFGQIVVWDDYQDDYGITVKDYDTVLKVTAILKREKVKMTEITKSEKFKTYHIDFGFGVY